MKILKIGTLVCVVLLVATIGCCTHTNSKPLASLTIGLQGPWEAVSAEFDKRVQTKFPLGTSEKDMEDELQRQGFSHLKGEAIRREDDFVCNKAAYVHWQADKQGYLTSINGSYREEGCL